MQELELRQRALEQQEALTKSAIKENKLQYDKNRKQRLADKLPSWTDNDLPDAYLAKFQSTTGGNSWGAGGAVAPLLLANNIFFGVFTHH